MDLWCKHCLCPDWFVKNRIKRNKPCVIFKFGCDLSSYWKMMFGIFHLSWFQVLSKTPAKYESESCPKYARLNPLIICFVLYFRPALSFTCETLYHDHQAIYK